GQIVDRSWYTAEKYAPYREPNPVKIPFWLQPERHFIGVVWYRREVEIPEAWRGKRIVLRLERAHIATSAVLDGVETSRQTWRAASGCRWMWVQARTVSQITRRRIGTG